MKQKGLAILNTVFLGLHIMVSYLSQTGIFFNTTIGDISDNYENLFTPAGITFSIWGLIYFSLAAFCIYHLINAFKKAEAHGANRDLIKTGYLLAATNLGATVWVFAWTAEAIGLSLVIMFIQWILLYILSRKLNIHNPRRSMASKAFTQFPISIFYGWISLAFFANSASYLKAIGWNGWGISEINWTITVIAVIMLITQGILNRRRNVFFAMVIIWGFYGIILKRQEAGAMEYQPIIWVSWACMAILALGLLFALLRNLRIRRDPFSEEIPQEVPETTAPKV